MNRRNFIKTAFMGAIAAITAKLDSKNTQQPPKKEKPVLPEKKKTTGKRFGTTIGEKKDGTPVLVLVEEGDSGRWIPSIEEDRDAIKSGELILGTAESHSMIYQRAPFMPFLQWEDVQREGNL